jgi:hypothetical protein
MTFLSVLQASAAFGVAGLVIVGFGSLGLIVASLTSPAKRNGSSGFRWYDPAFALERRKWSHSLRSSGSVNGPAENARTMPRRTFSLFIQ